jgi:hypothetical protein
MPIHGGILNGTLSGGITGRSASQTSLINNINVYHRRCSTSTYTAANAGTFTIMKYARHWWGVGNCHIYIYETWYGGNSSYGHFLIHGHTRSGNPSIGTVYNTGISTPFASNYNSTYERCDIQFSHDAYRRFNIIANNFESTYATSDGAVGLGATAGPNSWHMYSSTEII